MLPSPLAVLEVGERGEKEKKGEREEEKEGGKEKGRGRRKEVGEGKEEGEEEEQRGWESREEMIPILKANNHTHIPMSAVRQVSSPAASC